jgi:signal transduction histidine kinase
MECKLKEFVNTLSLSKRFFIVSVIILLFILLVFNVIILQNFKKVFIEREKKLFKQWIETSIKEHLRFFIYKKEWNKNIDFTPLVNEIKKLPDIINITFYSPDGKILYTLNESVKKNKCLFYDPIKKASRGDFYGQFFVIKEKKGNSTVQAFFYPFIFHGKLNGIIQVCKNPSNLLKQIDFLRLIVLLISFFGFLSYMIIVYFIITRIERREKKLQEEIHQYQRLSCLGHFSAKMSHELGTPIHVIQGNVELIGDLTNDDFVKERIEVVNRQIHKINNIIKNYLYLAKEPVPEYNFFYLKEFLLKLIDDFSFTIPDNISIETVIEDCTVYSDKDFIEQILYNFVKNSVDSIGEKKGRIIIKSYIKENYLHIEIIDNGRGFSNDVETKLFDPFFTTKKTGKGTGLGLSVCKDLIESLNGYIYCNSKKGMTLFGIKIPVER